MTYLPSLFKRIDSFYDQVMFITKTAETDYAAELKGVATGVGDPGLRKQLNTLAELYNYALSIGGGYATIARAIENLKEMYSDDSDTDIEYILNGMLKVLAKEAGGPQALAGRDNPRFMERLMQLKQDIDARSEEDDSSYDDYQDEVNVPGAQGEGQEDYSGYGLGGDTEAVAPAALGFGSKDDPKVNRGWHTVGPSKLYKNWREYYENEANAYAIQLAQTDDPEIKSALEELIKLIPQVSDLVDARTKLADQIKVAPDEGLSKKLAVIQLRLKGLKEMVASLKKNIRSAQLKREEESIKAQLIEATRKNDPRAQELFEQKLALNRLTQSSDIYKAKERNLRLRLIDSMSGGNFPGKETLEKEKSKIELAKTDRKAREDYDREITEERGKQQARLKTPEYESGRGGARVPMKNLPQEEQIDLEKASFSALVYQFQIDIASATQAARQAIYRAESGGGGRKGAKAKENPEYKKIIDEISEAIRKKDRTALYAAQTKLMTAVSNDMHVEKNQLKGFVDVIRLEPHFRKVLEAIKDATKNEKATKQNPNPAPPKLDADGNIIAANFTEQDKAVFEYILNDIHRLRVLYTKYFTDIAGMIERRTGKPSTEWWEVKKLITPRFKKVIEDMGRLEIYLALNLKVRRPEDKKLYQEKSPSLKDIAEQQKGSSIAYRMNLLRFAQEVVPQQEVDKDTADRMANEMFDKIFEDAYQRMLSELTA